MTALATAFVQLRVDGSKVGPDIRSNLTSPAVTSSATKAGQETGKKFTSGFASNFKSFAAGAVAGFGLTTLISGFKDIAAEGREAQKATGLTNAVIKSTGGVANVTAAEVSALAQAISEKVAVDDEAIQSGENMLLTFTNVRNEVGAGNDIFNQATRTIVDMAAAFGGDATSNAKLLGKALNDPVAGLTALTRVGVAFTAGQKEQITAAAEAGDVLKAQKIILAELARETEGAAASQATAGERAGVVFANLQEDLAAQLLPLLDDIEMWFADEGADAIRDFGGVLKNEVLPPLALVADGVGVLADVFGSIPGPAREAIVVLGLAALAARKLDVAGSGRAFGASLSSGLDTVRLQAMYAKDQISAAAGPVAKLGTTAGIAARGGVSALAKGAGGLVSALGGPWGIALGGAAVGLTILGKESAAAADAQADLNAITTTLVDTLNKQTQAATKATLSSLVSELSDVTEQANRADLALETIAGAAVGNAGNFADVAKAVGLSTDELRQMVGVAQSLNSRDQFGVFSELTDDQTELVYALAQTSKGFVNAQDAARLSADAIGTVAGAFTGARDPVKGFGKDVDDTTDAMQGFNSVAATIIDRQLGLAQAIMDAEAALDEQDNGFRKNTEAGQKNWEQVLALANATDGYSASTEKGRAAIERARGAIIDYADAQGMTAEEARKLAARLLGVKGAADDVNNTPARARVSETGADETMGKIGDVRAGLANLDGDTATVTISLALSATSSALRAFNIFGSADGNLIEAYGSGGIREQHVAQIAKAGAWRVWAEDETGGEAYIPLAPSKRTRSLDIWKETGKQLGALAMGDGGVFSVGGLPSAQSAERVLEDMKDTLHESRDHLRDLLASQRDLSQTISSGFDTTTYGAGAPTSARDLFTRARAEVNDAKLFRHVLNQLKAKGANPSLLAALASAGPGAIVQAQALAGLSRKELNRYQRLLGAGNRAQDSIGDFVSNQVFDRRVDEARDKVERLGHRLDHLRRAIDDLPKKFGDKVADSLDHTAVRMDGRKVGELLTRDADVRRRGGR